MLNYLINLSHQVEKIYFEMDECFSSFQIKNGLTCLPHCGQCCQKNGIEASMLEVLPLAIDIWKRGDAIAFLEESEQFLKKIESGERAGCYFYDEAVHCTVYSKRATICRIFGAFVRRNRHALNELSVCHLIKKERQGLPPLVASLDDRFEITSWSWKLENLDLQLGRERYPLFWATRLMLEKILFYDSFTSKNPIKTSSEELGRNQLCISPSSF